MEKLRDINPAHERFGYLGLVVAGAVVLAIGLLVRSDLFLSVVGFVLEIIGWLGILCGAAIAAVGVAAFGHERGWWDRIIEANSRSGAKMPLARGLSGSVIFLLAILFFVLPWMSVSCFDEELLSASGTDIMGITQIDDIPSEIADDDYGIGDASGQRGGTAVRRRSAGGRGRCSVLSARQAGKLPARGTGGRGNRVSARFRSSDAVVCGLGVGSRHRRA